MTNPTFKFSNLTDRLAGRRSRAWDVTDRAVSMEGNGQEIFHLGVGDPDFDTPRKIVAAAVTAIESGRTHYSPISGEPVLRTAIAQSGQRDFDLPITTEQVTIFPGAQSALFATLLCLAGPGDEVILLEPFYATYEGVATAGGATVVPVSSSAKNNFAPSIKEIAQAITKNTRVILANSPGNPSGAVFSKATWEALVEICIAHGIWLVSDEVYGNLVFEGEHYSPLSTPGAEDNVVAISSVSKSHAMTGWRLGWAIAPAKLTEHLGNLAQCMQFGVSQFTQDAAAFALENSAQEVAELRDGFCRRRDVLCDALDKTHDLIVHRPAGGMFAMVDVSRLGIDGDAFANRLLDDCGVAVVPGFAFGDSMHNYVRIGYLLDAAKLKIAADKITKFVSSVNA